VPLSPLSPRRADAFTVAVAFRPLVTVVSVRGEVDLMTASTLHAVLDSLLADGHAVLALDIGEVSLLGAAGISVISTVATRLTLQGGSLTVRAPGALAVRILELTGLGHLVVTTAVDADATPELAAEQVRGDHSWTVAPRAVAPLPTVGGAGVPARTDVVDAALRLAIALAAATIDGADGVSVPLEREAVIGTVAATNETVLRMDAHQYSTDEGPCLAAARDGRWFHIESLADETRWPAFVPRARSEGIASILSTPLMLADRSVGALNIYSNAASAFGAREQRVASLFASQVSGILDDATSFDLVGEGLADALGARALIAQAQGVVMTRRHVSADEAAAILRRDARTNAVSVLLQATQVVSSTAAVHGASS